MDERNNAEDLLLFLFALCAICMITCLARCIYLDNKLQQAREQLTESIILTNNDKQ